MIALAPPLLLVLAWLFALIGWDAPGADSSTPFDEQALRWMLLLGMGWSILGGAVTHTFLRPPDRQGDQLGDQRLSVRGRLRQPRIGLAGVYASTVDESSAWVVASLAGGIFLLLAGVNHIVEIVRDRNYAPGNTAILLSDLGVPISLLALLIATGSL